jgi:hypothetical protein
VCIRYVDVLAVNATRQFSVMPRYTNVDIRVFLDIPVGQAVRMYVTRDNRVVPAASSRTAPDFRTPPMFGMGGFFVAFPRN